MASPGPVGEVQVGVCSASATPERNLSTKISREEEQANVILASDAQGSRTLRECCPSSPYVTFMYCSPCKKENKLIWEKEEKE